MPNPIVAMAEEREPLLWRACYPRIYRNTEQYGSPKVPAAVALTALTWLRDGWQSAPATARNIYYAVCQQQRFGMPSLFVSPELCAALGQTEPPADLSWVDMPLPFDAGVLMLPRGVLLHPTDGNVDFLGWAHVRANEPMRFGAQFPLVAVREDIFVVYTGLADKPTLPMLDTVLNASTSPNLGDTSQTGMQRYRDGQEIYELPLAADERDFLQQCRSLIFSLLLAIDTRPAILSRGKRVGMHSKSQREIWEPNIVGRTYRVTRERSTETGTHASPRAHWRRGHFRNQAFGAGRTETKRIWIEPTLVGAGE